MALEVAFPESSIAHLSDAQRNNNHRRFTSLQSGAEYAGERHGWVGGGILYSGSRAEGLAVERGWGHTVADEDVMKVFGCFLGVHVPEGPQPPGRATLIYRPDGCPTAYCKLEVTHPDTLIGLKIGTKQLGIRCIHRSEGVDWLHANNLLRVIEGDFNISGPAGQSGLLDSVPALACNGPHPHMDQKYIRRPRHGWPSQQQLDEIHQLPMLLVLVGHKYSREFPLQVRLSWSHYEIRLIAELPIHIRQVYIALKYIFKSFMKKLRDPNEDGDGRSHVGSFHLKTVFLHNVEKSPPSMKGSHLGFMLDLLYDFNYCVLNNKLPHYFLPDCNLLETVGPAERLLTCNVINRILSDPVRAILMSPIYPRDIYGDIRPDALAAAFHQVYSPWDCRRSHEKLFCLLIRLDQRRHQRYNEQLLDDSERHGVPVRPKLISLVDKFEEDVYFAYISRWSTLYYSHDWPRKPHDTMSLQYVYSLVFRVLLWKCLWICEQILQQVLAFYDLFLKLLVSWEVRNLIWLPGIISWV